MPGSYDIFLSYSHQDSGIARNVASALEAEGITCFMAEADIRAGEIWADTIRTTLQEASRLLLLVTPRSKNSLWLAAEAGAAWALKKELIAALMFVEPSELIEPIKRHQTRSIETPEQLTALVNEVAPQIRFDTDNINGQWIELLSSDTNFFRQEKEKVVGFTDYSTGNKKVGVYLGTLKNMQFDYEWRWLNGSSEGRGRMTLSDDGKKLSGPWWYGHDKGRVMHLELRRVSYEMPHWLHPGDFDEFLTHFESSRDDTCGGRRSLTHSDASEPSPRAPKRRASAVRKSPRRPLA